MTKQNILQKVQQLIREVFDNEMINVKADTTAKEVEEWDSLNHIQLIGAIEEHFNIEFDLEEMLALENVGDIVEQIEQNTNH